MCSVVLCVCIIVMVCVRVVFVCLLCLCMCVVVMHFLFFDMCVLYDVFIFCVGMSGNAV